MTPTLSVVIPFRDEADSLPILYRELVAVIDGLGMSSEMIFVDDESRDDGVSVLSGVAGGDERFRLLSISPHSGQSAALEAGFGAARGEWIATLDADLQNDPADLPRLLAEIEGADCVNGVRLDRQDSFMKRIASRVANSMRRRILGDTVEDIGCSLRVMRATYLERIKLFRGSHRFLPILLALEGARVVEVSVSHRPRLHGKSKYAISDRFFEAVLDLCAVAWMKQRICRYDVKELDRHE
jgi:glycosyltransferase involved in cell wall biosynthesis